PADTDAPEPSSEATDSLDGLSDPEKQTTEASAADSRVFSEAEKALLAEIKTKDPKFAAKIRNALFRDAAFAKAVPGGLREVQQLQRQLEDLGGFEKIEEMRSEVEEWNALDQQFVAGDPRFVESIASGSPESFLKLAPTVFGKFQEMNPKGYASYVSQAFLADMSANEVPFSIKVLKHFVPADNAEAREALSQIDQYVERLKGFAKEPIHAEIEKPAPDSREIALSQREESLVRTEWKSAADRDRLSIFNTELKTLTQGRKVSDQDLAAIKELYATRLAAGIKAANKDFNANVDRYFSARDQRGYMRYMNSIYKKEIPKALRSAVDTILRKSPPAKAAAAATNG